MRVQAESTPNTLANATSDGSAQSGTDVTPLLSKRRHLIPSALTIVALLVSLVSLVSPACTSSPGVKLADAERMAATCPANGAQAASLVQVDRSGSRRNPVATPAEEQLIREAAERTAICGGHLRVTLFSGSIIGVTVFDADLQLDGATANARLRKAPKAVDAVMEQIDATLPGATRRLDDGATDIVGQYQLGAEYLAQLTATGSFRLEQTILTDGIQTAGQDLGDPALTTEQAQTLAATFPVPDLSGATVRLIGIGRQVDDAPLTTPYIAALRTFHTTVCENTRATCTVVTDAAGA